MTDDFDDAEHISAEVAMAAYPQHAAAGRDAAQRWIDTVNPSIHEIRYVAGLDWLGENLPKGVMRFLPRELPFFEYGTFVIAFSRHCDQVAEPQPA